jgi:hypothetical protein
VKWPAIAPAWMYRDPAEIADALLRAGSRVQTPAPAACPDTVRDRYYTAARRFHVKQVMKGRR